MWLKIFRMVIILLVLFGISFWWQKSNKITLVRAQPTLGDLPIIIPGYTIPKDNKLIFVDYFNEVARPDDFIQFAENSLLRDLVIHLQVISKVTTGVVIQSFASWQTAREQIDNMTPEQLNEFKNNVDCLNYDLEKWEKSRNEWENIAASSLEMRRLADELDMCYIGGITGRIDEEKPGGVEEMAQYVDIYNAHWFGYPERYGLDAYVDYLIGSDGIATRAKEANPDTKLILSVSVEKDNLGPVEIVEFFDQVAHVNDINGIFSQNQPGSFLILSEVIDRMRVNIPPITVPGDTNGDGVVDVVDFLNVVSHFGEIGPGGNPIDVNNDGKVDIFDVNMVAGNFGLY